MQCHWQHEHGPHDWWPAVSDPDNPRLLHLGMSKVDCPGKKN